MNEQKMKSRFTPSVSVHTHFLVAGLVWSCVGLMLFYRGAHALLQIQGYIWLAGAILVGTLKGLMILDKTARKNINRIKHFDDKKCIGGVYSWKTWVLVIVMMVSGFFLRHSTLPIEFVGVIYAAVGWALMVSSRLAWLEWFA